jgi:glycogen debranching enzyme
LPFSLCIDQYTYGKWEVIQPFVIPIAIWDYYLKSNDKDFLTGALPVLAKFDKWMMKNRDENNEDLINIKEASGESGWDNSKRYVLGEHLIQSESPIFKQNKFIQSPDFNTYLYISRKIILKIAREIGKEIDYKDFQSKMERTESGIQGMWNNEIGLYMDRFEKDHKQIPVRTPGGIIPLLCGFTEPERIKKIIRNLKDPDIFWTPFPVATLDMKDPAYSNKDDYFSYWNGRIWPHINWLVIEALYRSKEHITALDLSKLTIRMCYATGEPLCMENYDPDTGYPYLSHNCFNYIWGGMFLDILMRRIAGFQGNAPKNEVYINPLLNEDITRLSIKDIKIGEHIIDFSLKSTTEKEVDLIFSHRGAVPIDLITSSGREKVCNTEIKRKITFFDAPHFLDL